MKELFLNAIEWLRSRVTAIRSEKLWVKRDEVKDTLCVYADDDKKHLKVKGDRLEANVRCLHSPNSPSVYRGSTAEPGGRSKRSAELVSMTIGNDTETFNSHLSSFNSKLTIPDIEKLLHEKYELRYNVLTEQSEYRTKESDAPFAAVTQRVYKTWMADLQADGYNVWWAEGVRIAAESMHIMPYHPVTHYFSTLPEWDGTDRLRPLAGLSRNRSFLLIMGAVLLLQILFVYLGGSVLRTMPLTPSELGVTALLSLSVLPAEKVRVFLWRARGRQARY